MYCSCCCCLVVSSCYRFAVVANFSADSHKEVKSSLYIKITFNGSYLCDNISNAVLSVRVKLPQAVVTAKLCDIIDRAAWL